MTMSRNRRTKATEINFRMYQCRVCKKSFKRSQGVLFISGFFCDEHNPCNKIHLKTIDYRNVPDTFSGNVGMEK